MLPFEYSRCTGTAAKLCAKCARRDKGRAEYQAHVGPEYSIERDYCENFIARIEEK